MLSFTSVPCLSSSFSHYIFVSIVLRHARLPRLVLYPVYLALASWFQPMLFLLTFTLGLSYLYRIRFALSCLQIFRLNPPAPRLIVLSISSILKEKSRMGLLAVTSYMNQSAGRPVKYQISNIRSKLSEAYFRLANLWYANGDDEKVDPLII